MDKIGAVGIMDSGIGGLSVLSECLKRFPNENFVYIGDGKNCPYGNRDKDEIYSLSAKMLDFLKSKRVKCALVACNTVSALGDGLWKGFDFPIIDIVSGCAKAVANKGLAAVGLIATPFTVRTGVYTELIKKDLPDCRVVSVASDDLAGLVETFGRKSPKITAEIIRCVDKILAEYAVKDIILGCTHYSIATETFKKRYPEINFIDPAVFQCDRLEKLLGLNSAKSGGRLEVYSTGGIGGSLLLMESLGIKSPAVAATVKL